MEKTKSATPYQLPVLTQELILGRKVQVVASLVERYSVGLRLVGPRATHDLVNIGGGLFQPRNSQGNFCAISGNYFFWVNADGSIGCGTQFQFQLARHQDA